MRTLLCLGLCLLMASACQQEGTPEPHTFTCTFEEGPEGWSGNFADYPVDTALRNSYQLSFGYASLPTPLDTTRHALRISGRNGSDDLFMFISRKVEGLTPLTRYHLSFRI